MEAVHEEMERDPSGTDGRQHEMGFVRGHSLNDVRKVFRFFDPLPPCRCVIQYYRHVMDNPPPSPSGADVI